MYCTSQLDINKTFVGRGGKRENWIYKYKVHNSQERN